MHPPRHICEALYKKAPFLRLGWAGREGFNEGSFHLLKLYPSRRAWDRDGNAASIRMYWDIQEVPLACGGMRLEKIYRGPVFDRWGGGTLDYDPHRFFPVSVAEMGPTFQSTIYDVFSGKFLSRLTRKSIYKEMKKFALAEGKRKEDYFNDMAHGIVDLADHVNRHGAASDSPLAYKHAMQQVKSDPRAMQQLEGNHSMVDRHMANLPKAVRDA